MKKCNFTKMKIRNLFWVFFQNYKKVLCNISIILNVAIFLHNLIERLLYFYHSYFFDTKHVEWDCQKAFKYIRDMLQIYYSSTIT